MFLQELKNSNNKNRLLTDKMNGTTVFKIPDELWDRSYPMFCVELLGPNIKLECRPHGFTEEDVPVYTRTGKVANKLPYPEDIVRYEKNSPFSCKFFWLYVFLISWFQVSCSFTSLENRNLSLCLCQPYIHDRKRWSPVEKRPRRMQKVSYRKWLLKFSNMNLQWCATSKAVMISWFFLHFTNVRISK